MCVGKRVNPAKAFRNHKIQTGTVNKSLLFADLSAINVMIVIEKIAKGPFIE